MLKILFILYVVILAVCSIFGVHRLFLLYLYLKNRSKVVSYKNVPIKTKPTVTVQLPIFNEMYVAERLIDSVCSIDYPKHLLEVQVLDDSNDATVELIDKKVKEYRKKGIDISHILRPNREGFKAGALNYGMEKAKGEYFLIFDSDFVPPADIIYSLLPPFNNPEVGMVQARWGYLNKEYSALTEAQSFMLEGMFEIDHTARNTSGRFINFNGTAGMWRKNAIQEAGGWKSHTITEDLDISYRAQLKGWKFVYLPDVICPSELPTELNSFKTQQKRWSTGMLQTARILLPEIWKSPIPLSLKLESTMHMGSNLLYTLMILVSILLGPVIVYRASNNNNYWIIDYLFILINSLSHILFYLISTRNTPKSNRNMLIYKLVNIIVTISITIGLSINNGIAALSAFFKSNTVFVRTAKYGVKVSSDNWKNKKYRVKTNYTSVLEIIFTLYFFSIIVYSINKRLWIIIPFLLLFLFGFGYMGITSISEHIQRKQTIS